jgi:S1-C subfamily serine protease
MRILSTLIVASCLLLSGCAAMLNGSHQKVAIKADSEATVQVNGTEVSPEDGKFQLERNGRFQQITFSRDGYKDAHVAISQTSLSPLYIFSVIPFGILIYPAVLDAMAPRSYNYPKEYIYTEGMYELPKKEENGMDMQLNKVGLDLKAEQIQFRFYPNYKYFIRGQGAQEQTLSGENENFKVENTVFASLLNEVLKERGYVDTTRKVFKRSYLSNLLLDATVTRYRINQVNNSYGGSMMFVDLTIDWKIKDYYDQTIGEFSGDVTSGQFAYSRFNSGDMRLALEASISDALESGLIELLYSSSIQKVLKSRDRAEIEAAFAPLPVGSAPRYASSVAEAVKSTVTVKSTDGHGSGFIIGSDGYIVTNHHVVLDTVPPTVILNDGSEHTATVIRESLIHDLALLQIDTTGLTPLKISNNREVEIASDVYVIGTPTSEDLPQTVSRGIISGIRTPRPDARLLQTDASINGGNSGGPIINASGEVIGVVSTKIWGFGIEGVAFGIPAYEIADRLKVTFR